MDNLPKPHKGPRPSTSYEEMIRNQRAETRELNSSKMPGTLTSTAYSWRAPSPPHIHVPNIMEDKELTLRPHYDYQCESPEDSRILGLITQSRGIVVRGQEWEYEWRRAAQPILSFLYLGPSSVSRDLNFLKQEGITMLLVVRNTMMGNLFGGDKIAAQLGIESASIDVAGNAQLIASFPAATKKINDHLISTFRRKAAAGLDPVDCHLWGKVLVYCESGNERSASIVAAYIMEMYNMDIATTVLHMQKQRFCVCLDEDYKNLLLSYQSLLEARQSLLTNGHQVNNTRSLKRERRQVDTRNREEDSMSVDEELMDEDDELRFGRRSDFRPFIDASGE